MPDAFFQSDRKRKRPPRAGPSSRGGGGFSRGRGGRGGASSSSSSSRRPRPSAADEDLSSDAEGEGRHVDIDDLDFRSGRRGDDAMSDDGFVDANETAAEKRVRMAKGYLQKVRDEVEAAKEEGDYDAAEIDREIIASRLKQDVDEAEGRIHLFLASHLLEPQPRFLPLSAHIPTSIAVTPRTIYISTKRGSILPFSLPSLMPYGAFGHSASLVKGKGHKAQSKGTKSAKGDAGAEGHTGELLAIAASEDGKWLVSGGRDRVVGVWDVSDPSNPLWLAGMRGHKDAVSSLVLPPLSNPSAHVLSASLSRHLTLHSLSTLSALDTFFGHQDSIGCVSALKPTDAVTSGARDRTCRWWKIEEEVQLVFRGGGRVRVKGDDEENGENGEKEGEEGEASIVGRGKARGGEKEYVEGSIEVVCALDDSHFLSGGDSGTIALWSTGKKKPIFSYPLAHGTDSSSYNPLSPSSTTTSSARWITSLAFLRGTDLFASGSWDGSIRLWALDESIRSFRLVREVSARGFVNALSLLAVPLSVFEGTQGGEGGGEEEEGLKGQRTKKEIVLAAAVSQEPRLGRWIRLKERNGLLVVRLPLDQPLL